MASNTFSNIVSSYGLKSNGVNAIDVIAGIPVKISHYQGNPTVYIYAGSKENASLVASSMKDAAKNAGIMPPKASGDSITFGFKKPRLAVEHYQNIREIVSAHAGSLNFDQCPYCFMGSCDVAGMFKGTTARKMHRACFLNNRNNEMDKINNSDGNYITGIIGALLAAVIIVALADLLVLGAERVFYILYLGFPLFIAGGFRLGKGPYGSMGTFCHVVISVLAMFVYFYIQGCYYAAQYYGITIAQAVPYFGDIMEVILDPEFIRYSALEIVLFVVGLLIAIFANPTSKKQGRKAVQQNDVFITPLSMVNTGFSGADTYQPFGSTQDSTAGYDTSYGSQSAYDQQNAYGTQDTYGDQNAQSGDNSDFNNIL